MGRAFSSRSDLRITAYLVNGGGDQKRLDKDDKG